MSILRTVRVEDVSGACVTFEVTTVHPDAGPPSKDPTYGLNLLVELWYLHERGFVDRSWGLDDAAAREVANREPWGSLFRRLRPLSHGEEVPASEEELEDLRARSTGPGFATFRGRPVAPIGGGSTVRGMLRIKQAIAVPYSVL